MPFGYSDSFTDVNGTLLQAHVPDSGVPFVWTKLGANNIAIQSNRLSIPATGSASRYRANVDTLDDDGDYVAIAYIIVAGVNASVGAAISIVKPGTSDGYRLVLSMNLSAQLSFSLGRMTGGGVVALDDSGFLALPSDGIHELKIVKSGNTITGYWRGVVIVTAVDLTHQGTSELAIDGISDADNSYVVGAIAAGTFDPIEPFPDPAEAAFDCDNDPAAEPVLDEALLDTFTDLDATLLIDHVPEGPFSWTKHPDSIGDGYINAGTADNTSNFGRMWYSGNGARVDVDGAFEIEAQIEISEPPVSSQVAVWLIEDADLFTGYELLINVFVQLGSLVELIGLASHSDPATSTDVAPFGPTHVPVAGTFPLKLRKQGNLITGYWKGMEVVSFVNSEFPSITAIGIRYNGNDGVTFVHNYRVASVTTPNFIAGGPDVDEFADPAIPVYTVLGDP